MGKKIDLVILIFILLLGLIFRLYKINSALTDQHSWRQADTAAVARNYVKQGINLLYPRYDDLSNIQSGKDNPQGYRFVEFPLYNAAIAFLSKNLAILSLEVYGRLISIFFSLILIAAIYYLVLVEEGRLAAFFASLIFAAFPFFVFYSRVILPEMTALSLVFLSILTFYLFAKQTKKRSLAFYFFFIISSIFLSFSLLVKPTTVFFLIPILYLFYRAFGFNFLRSPSFYLYLLIAFLPTALWRIWISRFPEGIPAYDWLLYQVNTPQGRQVIFLRPAFFRWIFQERILNLILGGYTALFFILGLLKKPKKSLLFFFIGLASLTYLFTFQGGNVQHDYYQILILPTLSIFSGAGIAFLVENKKIFLSSFLNWSMIIIVLAFSFFFSYFKVRDFYSDNKDLVNIANIIRTVTEEEAKIVTDTTGDTTLLYLSKRRGYPAPTKEFNDLKKDGMEYFVTTKTEVAESMRDKFEIVFENDKVYIFKL